MSQLNGAALCFSHNSRPILDHVDISLEKGEMLGLIGPNGAGKSTLLRLIAGVITPDEGELTLHGKPLSSFSPRERAKHIAFLPQLSEIAWPMHVERLVALGRIPHLEPWQHPTAQDRDIIEQIIEQTDLGALRHRPYNNLSGGEQARVRLARALATEADILLADEPVSALDPAHQLDVMALLEEHCQAGQSVIVVLHDLTLAVHYCRRLQLLHQGETLAEGTADEVLSDDNLETAYAIAINQPVSKASAPLSLPWRRLNR
ncbi:MAG: ABC transporter ATP-binding protein [Candidatus Thiodiazotropha sp. (ex Lucinoma borealis)]|nr:ABC transporter ATP-binding protein [Candidatus Thiodiazotropha sp. (ex Lucinoma borealis)]MCU7862930.1 ABC transporter ATP-binding protein [Candidatus Thiodiazotropha sp. (ex Lucinoma borealis)]MCU7868748.1 ABC transporter ATP-binding protein [Candidatus Thiodiazotropha sp. (ex Lucinoma borealis)]